MSGLLKVLKNNNLGCVVIMGFIRSCKLCVAIAVIALVGCSSGGGDSGGVSKPSSSSTSSSTSTTSSGGAGTVAEKTVTEIPTSVVDATSVGADLVGVEATDQKGNIVTAYVGSTSLADGTVVTEGVDLGAPDNYKIITNKFLKISYPDIVEANRQTVMVEFKEHFTTVMVYDPSESLMKRTPFIVLDDNKIRFRAKPVSGEIIFSLIDITE